MIRDGASNHTWSTHGPEILAIQNPVLMSAM
jgi:hypothetical protein